MSVSSRNEGDLSCKVAKRHNAEHDSLDVTPPCVLVVNPNSSLEMTLGMRDRLCSLHRSGRISREIQLAYVTADKEAGVPPSIDDFVDEITSAHLVHRQIAHGNFKALREGCVVEVGQGASDKSVLQFREHSLALHGDPKQGPEQRVRLRMKNPNIDRSQAVLVACFSNHPLAQMLRVSHPHLKVLHILEAAVLSALSSGGKFGILTTVQSMVDDIDEGVCAVIGHGHTRFVGTVAAGVNAAGLDKRKTEVDRLVSEAAGLLASKGAKAIILGCAAMGDRASLIRQACRKENVTVTIVDGTIAGVHLLTNLLHSE
ncbi:Asp/Glu/hydantoin racemase [Ceraceosorus bombacis]|uniref:Asp/Glu/hydantoin racemase n=1 Tax=Ceraceosorus bombacis TaxID=401625 RepID=A0A0P1BM67_9BASI|nr:Asp/Glu/hydantoin racemase [Ceraceosorus bombacis]